MNVVRHHHPSQKIVSLVVIESDGLIDHSTKLRTTQPARASTFVEVLSKLVATLSLVFNFQQRHPLCSQVGGKRIDQMKRDKLRQTGFGTVGQITALVPAAKPQQRI